MKTTKSWSIGVQDFYRLFDCHPIVSTFANFFFLTAYTCKLYNLICVIIVDSYIYILYDPAGTISRIVKL